VPGTYATEKAKLEAALSRLLAVTERYPESDVGTEAMYYSGATLAGLGRLDEAAALYQDAAARDPRGIYGEMAQIGLASVHLRRGEADQAIAIYEALSEAADAQSPVDGLLLEMARAYVAAGKTEDAARTYQRIVDEFPQSVYLLEARQALDRM
jgi:TolA-binding protein